MLSPEYYEGCADDIVKLYEQLEDDIISDVARHIVKTGKVTESAGHQIEQLQEAGLLYDDILSEIAKRTDATNQHVKALFEDAGVETVEIDNEVYRENGLTPVDIRQSPAMRQTLEAGYSKTLGDMKNLTMTTANTSQTAYINACNQAYMQIQSGAFSPDEAIKQAIKKAAGNGATVLYPSGHTERIDVAIRRAVLTGVGQTCREICKTNAEESGCDIMEITAHSGARPSHAVWQGKLVSLSGKNAGKIIDGCRVLSLEEIGYGKADGFGGCNCRHDWHPFFVGISKRAYSDKRLKELDAKNIEYNGKKYSEYEISQIQRRYEREIRAAKREQVAFKTAVEEAEDRELKRVMKDSLNYANSVVKAKQAKMRDFIKQTGQFRDYSREQNYADKNIKNSLTSFKNNGKIESNRSLININSEFIPASDVESAENFAKDTLGIPNVSYKGVDIVTANEWNKGLAETFSKFPELKKKFGFVGTCQERNRLLAIEVKKYYEKQRSYAKGKISEDTFNLFLEDDVTKYMKFFPVLKNENAQSFSGVNISNYPEFPEFYGISVSDKFGNNSDNFISILKKEVKLKHRPVGCDTIKSVLDHEIGHQLDNLLGIRNNPDVTSIFDYTTSEELKDMLSEYAVNNSNRNKYAEMIAEAWAEYCNNPEPRPIAKYIGDIIIEEYERKFG